MATNQHPLTPLAEALEAWDDIRQGLIDEVENIPAERFDFRPSPDTRSVAELLRHILEVSLMMTGELCRPDTDLHREPWPELLRRYDQPVRHAGTKTELLEVLRTSLEDACRRFREVGEAGIHEVMTRFDGKKGTKLAWMHHGLAHEEYHRGQLALYERLLGIKPALTRRIEGS